MEWTSITDKFPRPGEKCSVMGPHLRPDHVFIAIGVTWVEALLVFEKSNGHHREFYRIKGFNYYDNSEFCLDNELVTHWIGLKE